MLAPDPPPDDTQDQSLAERRSVVRAVVVSGGLIALMGTALIAFFFGTRVGNGSAAERHEISAAAWVGHGADGGVSPNETVASAPPVDNAGANDTAPTYAPTGYAPMEPPPHAPPDGGEEEPAEDRIIKRGEVRSGRPVIKSLTGLGLSMGDAHGLISALEGIYDFRRARPGQRFEVHLERDTRAPSYFRYEVSLVEIYEVRRRGDELKGRKKHVPTKKTVRSFGGTVASSLYAALKDLDAHPSLAGKIVEVLSNQVDFYKEQRPGDTFRVVVEEETLDETFLGYGPVLALEYNGVKAGKKRFFRFEPKGNEPTYYNEKGISVPRSVLSIPLHYTRISSPFGWRYHPILKRKKLHNGVDFAAGHGTQVWACRAGRVTIADRRGANGNLVAIDHGEGLSSYYAHLQRFARGIKRGVEVRARQIIGYVGSTGRSTGPHLHFGVKKNGRFLDPLKYKVRPGRPVPARHKKELMSIVAQRGELLDRTRIKGAVGPLANVPEAGEEVLGLEEFE